MPSGGAKRGTPRTATYNERKGPRSYGHGSKARISEGMIKRGTRARQYGQPSEQREPEAQLTVSCPTCGETSLLPTLDRSAYHCGTCRKWLAVDDCVVRPTLNERNEERKYGHGSKAKVEGMLKRAT